MKRVLPFLLILCFATCGAWAEDLYQAGKDAYDAKDYDKALQYYQQAADQGYAEGLRGIGNLYAEGGGVEKDINKAMEYWQSAADQGDTKALLNLGRLYAFGTDESVAADIDRALEYYQKAADMGNGPAFVGLGDLYRDGHGVEQDAEKAAEYYSKALELGIEEAGERLNKLEAGSDTSGEGQPGNKPATTYTAEANRAWYDRLDFSDETEKENALRGLIEAPESLVIYRDDGAVVWNLDDFAFVRDTQAPDTVNPSLWRNTQLNAYAGLFEVCDGIYQVRGYDMANATFIRTDNGWVVFDVLMCQEDMAAAKRLMEKHFGPIDVKGVLYSHSHIDHYGGIYGLISQEDAADATLPLEEQLASGKTVVLAPEGFLEDAVSENLYAGPAMSRRAQYQYGAIMKPGETGRMAIGIGLGQSVGTIGLLPPTYELSTNETITIDGLEIQFQLTPGTEAPAEMNAWFPKYKGLWLAENCTGTMHNIYTLRGAQVRNAADWAKYILEAEALFGDEAEVVFQSHNWPHWGNETLRTYMEDTAAVYQYINNQTLHYINQGMTAAEISRTLTLPERLDKVWYCRQYYGTLSHNIKAVYQRYMGWYDANPVNLNPLTPEDTAKKWVEYLGDVDAVLEKARADFENGEYQWVAQVTKELVYADPTNQAARELCADALEQLGYQAESGPWRSAYLMGAWELRDGNQAEKEGTTKGRETTMTGMTTEMILQYNDILTDALAAQNDNFTLKLNISDTGETFRVMRRDGVLLVYPGETSEACDCTITCKRLQLLELMGGYAGAAANMTVEGDDTVPDRLVKYITPVSRNFNIIEP